MTIRKEELIPNNLKGDNVESTKRNNNQAQTAYRQEGDTLRMHHFQELDRTSQQCR